MKRRPVIGLLLLLIVIGAGIHAALQFKRIANAYLYGYPLLLMDQTQKAMQSVGYPINQLVHSQDFPDHTFKAVVRPNNDTLYSIAWLDLSIGPLVLGVPDTSGRYYVMPLMDAWTNVFAMVGKRTTGTFAGNYLIAGPDWPGTPQQGLEVIRAPTNKVWLIGRIQTNGRNDVPAVAALQQKFSLTPLDAWLSGVRHAGHVYSPGGNELRADPNVAVEALNAKGFMRELARLMDEQYPPTDDEQMLAQLAKLGVVPGAQFHEAELGLLGSLLADRALEFTRNVLRKGINESRDLENGWRVYRGGIGKYGTDYGVRAGVALAGLGALPAEEASYPSAAFDGQGNPLNGQNRYRIHFAAGQTPPANAFWSLTMYDEQGFLVANPIGRYAIGDRDPLQYNSDGSLDIVIQHARPEQGAANWLPAPAGPFTLAMRIYLPGPSFLQGEWQLPPVELVD